MEIDLYQVDAFTSEIFGGNPAAVCPLGAWLPDETLLNIAAENNLSETAFFVQTNDGYHIRWFTPADEVALCGHATLSAAFIIFEFLNPDLKEIKFDSLSGPLIVTKEQDGLKLDFPAWPYEEKSIPNGLSEALGKTPKEFYHSDDWLCVFEHAEDIETLMPNLAALSTFKEPRGFIITALGKDGTDFISRTFYPNLNVPEDPVTGSAHCVLTPYWAKQLGKNKLHAYQASKRGGSILCQLKVDRVELTGQAVLYLKGKINV